MSYFEFALTVLAVLLALRSPFVRCQLALLLRRVRQLRCGPFTARFSDGTDQPPALKREE